MSLIPESQLATALCDGLRSIKGVTLDSRKRHLGISRAVRRPTLARVRFGVTRRRL